MSLELEVTNMTRSREKDNLVGQGQASLIELSSVDTEDS